MDTVLVTGGAGFLGSHVATHLTGLGFRVVIVDDLSGGFLRNVPKHAEFHKVSINDQDAIEALFKRYKFRHVYHLAAYAAEGLSHFIRQFNYTNNLLGSVNLVNAAVNHGTHCFVYTSSIAVYGSAHLPFNEETTPMPLDPYGVAKLAVELDLRAASHHFGMRYIIFRPHNVFGERQNLSDPYRNVIGIFMRQVMQGRPCSIFGDGSQTRAFSYAGDVAPIVAESVNVPEAYNHVFNIGADQRCTISDLARMVQKVMGRHVGVEYLSARNEITHAYCDHDKAKRVFRCQPSVSLDEGLRRMACWAQTINIDEIEPTRSMRKVEIERGLPLSWVNAMHGEE